MSSSEECRQETVFDSHLFYEARVITICSCVMRVIGTLLGSIRHYFAGYAVAEPVLGLFVLRNAW